MPPIREVHPPHQPAVRTVRQIPAPPTGDRLLGHQPAYAADPLGTFRRWSAEHGDAVRLRFGPIRVLLLTSAEAVEDVLVHEAASFRKAPLIRRAARSAIGDSLFTSEGEAWSRQRALLEPWFGADRMAAHLPVIVEEVTATIARWAPGSVVETLRETMRLSQRIGGRVLFGADATDADVERVAAALAVTDADFQDRVDSLLLYLEPDWLPTRRAARRRRAVASLDDLIYGLIDARRQRALGGPDLLGELLLRQPELLWLTDRLLRDNAMSLLVESREDPGLLLTWALYLLSRHPEMAGRVAEEADSVLGDREPTAADLPRLGLVGDVLRETLRLYPPVYSTGRQAVRDCRVAGIGVPRGTVVVLSQAVSHRDPARFPDPDAFRPDRWQETPGESLPTGAYAPFGIGPRRCLGEHLAWMIGVIGLALLLRDRRFLPEDPAPVEPRILLSLRPSREVLLRVLAPSDR